MTSLTELEKSHARFAPGEDAAGRRRQHRARGARTSHQGGRGHAPQLATHDAPKKMDKPT